MARKAGPLGIEFLEPQNGPFWSKTAPFSTAKICQHFVLPEFEVNKQKAFGICQLEFRVAGFKPFIFRFLPPPLTNYLPQQLGTSDMTTIATDAIKAFQKQVSFVWGPRLNQNIW